MTTLTASIANDKIKIRWDEPQVSSALNRKMGIIPPGVYEGGGVSASGSNLVIAPGVFITRDVVNNFGLVVDDHDGSSISCSSLFPATADKTWYVGVTVNYSSGNPTSGNYFLTDSVPTASKITGKDGLVFASVAVHNGDTVLSMATITLLTSARPTPYPERTSYGAVLSSDRNYGFMSSVQAYGIPTPDQKDALVGFPGSPTSSNRYLVESYITGSITGIKTDVAATITAGKFQISGWVYIGKGGSGTGLKYLSLRNAASPNYPATMLDMSMIYVSSLRNSSDSAALNPSTMADANGYYQNPWVYCDSSGGTPDGVSIIVSYTERSTFKDALANYASPGLTGMVRKQHAEDAYVKTYGVADDRWSIVNGDTVQTSINKAISAVNNLYKDTRDYMVSGWVLVRSSSNTLEVDFSAINVATYVSQGGTCIVTGPVYFTNSSTQLMSSSVASNGDKFSVTYYGRGGIVVLTGEITTGPSQYIGAIDHDGRLGSSLALATAQVLWSENSYLYSGTKFTASGGIGAPGFDSSWINHSTIYGGASITFNGSQLNPKTIRISNNAQYDGDTSLFSKSEGTEESTSVALTNTSISFLTKGTSASTWSNSGWKAKAIIRMPANEGNGGGIQTFGGSESVANNGTTSIGTELYSGIVMLHCTNATYGFAIYAMYSGQIVGKIYGAAGWTMVMDTASSINVYGTTIQNKTGSTITVRWGCYFSQTS